MTGESPLTQPVPTPADELPRTADLIVVGAGAMGAWTALAAVESGRSVILLDAWGVGHPRATSGGETRIIRSAHGPDPLYTSWSRRARELWLERQAAWGVQLLEPSGVLWFAGQDDTFEAASVEVEASLGIPHERLSPSEVSARWPQIGTAGLSWALYEPEGGTLMARQGVQAAVAAFQRAGGAYGLAGVRPFVDERGRLGQVGDGADRRWSAGTIVFACGPWLGRLFPDVIGPILRVTKQDVVFVGPAEGDPRFRAAACPAFVDYGAAYYGTPATAERGFKLAPDRLGPIFDPSRGERVVDPDSIRLARAYLRKRFPDLGERPVVETRVCQYESTPDGHFILDRHPAYEDVWLAGGGSGHGFKHGPRIGEYLVARLDGAAEGAQGGAGEARFRIGPRVGGGSVARTDGDAMADTWDLF